MPTCSSPCRWSPCALPRPPQHRTGPSQLSEAAGRGSKAQSLAFLHSSPRHRSQTGALRQLPRQAQPDNPAPTPPFVRQPRQQSAARTRRKSRSGKSCKGATRRRTAPQGRTSTGRLRSPSRATARPRRRLPRRGDAGGRARLAALPQPGAYQAGAARGGRGEAGPECRHAPPAARRRGGGRVLPFRRGGRGGRRAAPHPYLRDALGAARPQPT